MTTPKLSEVGLASGSPMGRPGRGWNAEGERWYLARVYINSQGYDSGGAYWGIGPKLWRAMTEDSETDVFFRARDRNAAKQHIRDNHDPEPRFFR